MRSRLYKKTANKIIMDSIKSVVFIDEKALEPFRAIPEVLMPEENLSIHLYKRFQKTGSSLTIHRFVAGDLNKPELIKYLFDNRDLVLLDWELDHDYATGKEYSLKLLADVVASPHLHFCAIYTSTTKEGDVFDNIISFFSGKTKVEFAQIQTDLEAYEDDIKDSLENVDIYDSKKNGRLIGTLSRINGLIADLQAATQIRDIPSALILVKIAFSMDFIKSDKKNPMPDFIDKDNKIMVINNTIVTLIKKNLRRDPENLVSTLSKQIISSPNSFTQLLGIEMQNIYARKGSFVDSNLLNISLKTFLFHRHQINGILDELPFELFIKDLLIAQAKLNLRGEQLTILEPDFLNAMSLKKPNATTPEIAKINTFYNGSIIDGERALNFGDIFHYKDSIYYMCITPLCDCLYPKENIRNKYFFVKGQSFSNIEEAINLGDEAFISYINETTCISWAGVGKGSQQDKHKPIYVKPNQLYIPSNIIVNSEITVNDWYNGAATAFSLTYKFTLRQQYAQRIANHAFAHPIRVGIDFVKKGPKEKISVAITAEKAQAEPVQEAKKQG